MRRGEQPALLDARSWSERFLHTLSELPALVQHVLERLDGPVALVHGEVDDLLERDPDVRDVLLDVAALVVLLAQALALADVGAEAPAGLLQPEAQLPLDLRVVRDRLLRLGGERHP